MPRQTYLIIRATIPDLDLTFNINYSFMPNCKGAGGQTTNFGEKNPQVHLIITRE